MIKLMLGTLTTISFSAICKSSPYHFPTIPLTLEMVMQFCDDCGNLLADSRDTQVKCRVCHKMHNSAYLI